MSVLKVTKENFEQEVLKSDKTVLVDFYADWCGPCKMLSPIVDAVAEERSDIKIVKVNIDADSELAVNYRVMTIPTLVVLENGKEVTRSSGLISMDELLELLPE